MNRPVLSLDRAASQQLYAVSLMAWKPSIPTASGQRVDLVEHQVNALVANSDEAAHRQAMGQALEIWPPADNWQGHHVQIVILNFNLAGQPLTTQKESEVEQELVM